MSGSVQTAFDFFKDDSTLSDDPRLAAQTPMERLLTVTGYPVRPTGVPTEDHWRIAETELGVTFPQSFKQLLELYGTGIWLETFELFSPYPDCLRRYTSWNVRRIVEMYGSAAQYGFGAQSFDLWPAKGGLLPLADTSSRLSLAWDTSAKDPDEWTIVRIHCDFPPERFSGSILDFLYQCASGKAFGDWLPSSPIVYRCGCYTEPINPFES